MVKYLLDTCVLVSVLRGTDNMEQKIRDVGISECAISEMTVAELYAGPYRKLENVADTDTRKRALGQIASIRELTRTIPVVPPSGCGEIFAKESERLRRAGERIEDMDLWIGAHALALGCILVTGNVRHFERISGIRIANWYENEK